MINRHHPVLAPLGVFVLILAVYLLTLMPGTVGGDAGELQYAGPLLALVHPTGQPLYVLLGKLWTALLPLRSAAYEMNLLAAVSTAGGCALLAAFVTRLWGSKLAGAGAGLALGLGATVWGQALLADKYGFNVLLAALLLGLVLWWDAEHDKPHGDRILYALCAAYALCVLHHRSLALFGVLIAPLVGWHLRAALWQRPRRTLICAVIVLLPPLLLYPTVLPWLEAREMTPLLWQPQGAGDWVDFLLERHVLSGEALVFDAGIGEQIRIYAETLFNDYTVALLFVAVLGFGAMIRRRPTGGLFLLAAFMMQAVLSANFRGNERQFTYYLPSFVALAYAYAAGLAAIWRWSYARRGPGIYTDEGCLPGMLVLALSGAILLGLPGYQLADTFLDARDESRHGDTLDIWRQTLKSGDMGARLTAGMDDLPQGAALAADWEQVTILWYTQQVEDIRPDLTIFYPIERFADYADTDTPVCLARHVPEAAGDARWRPSNVGALICLNRVPQFELPDGIIGTPDVLHNADGVPVLELVGSLSQDVLVDGGAHVPLILVWRALADDLPDYSISLQLIDEYQSVVWQRDIQSPVMGMYPTSRWVEGEVVTDYHELSVPRYLLSGYYTWAVVVYRALPDGTFENLTTADGATRAIGGSVGVR
jgi:hypothetical protein